MIRLSSQWGVTVLFLSKRAVLESPLTGGLFRRLEEIHRLARLIVVFAAVQALLTVELLWLGKGVGWIQPVQIGVVLVILFLIFGLIVASLRSAQREVLREWNQVEQNVRSGMGLSEDWLWTIDRDARFVYSSPSVSRFLGYSAEELMRQDSIEVMTPDANAEQVRLTLEDCALRRVGWSSWDLELIRRDGSIRFVRSEAVPLLNSDGELMGWQGTARDRTDHVVGVQELARRRQEISEVIAGRSDFEVVLQPIFDLGSGRLIGAEALSRFESDPPRGPAVWFAAAQELGLGFELEMFAITRALERMHELPPDAFLSINVSPDSFLALDPSRVPLCDAEGRHLVLELTEHVLVEQSQYPAMRRKAEVLRSAGIRVAVDDTGAGFSSLTHVVELTPDLIKLDRSIVRGIEGGGARSALAVSLSGFADLIGASVIAEGIESEAELRMVRSTGIRFGQGFGLAAPGPPPLPVQSLLHPRPRQTETVI